MKFLTSRPYLFTIMMQVNLWCVVWVRKMEQFKYGSCVESLEEGGGLISVLGSGHDWITWSGGSLMSVLADSWRYFFFNQCYRSLSYGHEKSATFVYFEHIMYWCYCQDMMLLLQCYSFTVWFVRGETDIERNRGAVTEKDAKYEHGGPEK